MADRTTIILDPNSRNAATELAQHWRCSRSEAIRRAVVELRDRLVEVPDEKRRRRVRAFRELCDLFDRLDAEAEVVSIRDEREHF